MARSDLLLSLIRAASEKDQALFTKSLQAMVADERAKQHHVLANQLERYLQNGHSNGHSLPTPSLRLDERSLPLLFEVAPRRKLSDLVLRPQVERVCLEVVEEQHRAELLRSYGMEPRHRVLLVGPPGNGKTSLAEAIAEALMAPMFVVRYETLIASYLGETAARLAQVFEHARTHQCVLFFDEFDTVAKERGDLHETGEIKRVVSTLLLQIDRLPSYVVVITATNHPELLDRAAWRRFQVRLTLPKPSETQLEQYFKRFACSLDFSLGHSPRSLAGQMKGASFSDAASLCDDIRRKYILGLPNPDVRALVSECLNEWRESFQATEAI